MSRKPRLATDDIPVEELMTLVTASGSYDWLDSDAENIYSLKDGEAIRWPNPDASAPDPGCYPGL